MKLKFYESMNHNPWFNLALETWLLNTVQPNELLLFIWRNKPTVVIGRAQNPWVECDIAAMEKNEILLARRDTGGGAVYHDLGNTNYSIICGRKLYDQKHFFALIIEALALCDIDTKQNGRNDIVINDEAARKISGNAFRLKKQAALHHGTLLINAKFDQLAKYLTPNQSKLESKGIRSVASRVANVTNYNAAMTHQLFADALRTVFATEYAHGQRKISVEFVDEESNIDYLGFSEMVDKMRSWAWLYGRTLPFTHQLQQRFDFGEVGLKLQVEDAYIKDVIMHSDALDLDWIDAWCDYLKGKLYSYNDIKTALDLAIYEHGREYPNQNDILKRQASLVTRWLQSVVI